MNKNDIIDLFLSFLIKMECGAKMNIKIGILSFWLIVSQGDDGTQYHIMI